MAQQGSGRRSGRLGGGRNGKGSSMAPVAMPAVVVADGLVGHVGTWPATGARGPMPPRQPRQFHSTLEQFSADPLAVTPRLRPMPPVASMSSVGTDRSERGKPQLLSKLQNQLDAELKRHETAGGDDAALLRVYGQCWDRLADEFTLYRPLLSAIKGEYERFIVHYDAEIARLQPTVEQIDEREAERAAVCANAELECAAKREALRLEVKEALALKKEKEAELKRVRSELKDMSIELELSKLDLKNLHSINLGLCDDINANEHKVLEIKTTEERDREQFPALKRELEDLKGRLQDIDDMMQQADQKLSDVDDELATKNAETRSLTSKLKNLTVELTRQQTEQKQVKMDLRESRRKVGALQRLLTSSSERPHTPRVDWEEVKGRHDSLKKLNIEQPSALVVNDMVAHMHELHAELERVRDKLPWVQAEKKQKQMMAGKWFVCRGTAPSVPKFLRMQGKVRNRNMQKRDCEQLIKEFWREKTKHNQSKAAGTVTVSDFLYNFLKSKYGVPAAIAEAGYNLIDALTRYQYDADCELFEKIIFGELCEETYYDQVEMMDGFIEACKAVDKKKNGKKGGRLGGTLKRPEFIETLKSFFQFKSVEDLAALQQAVIYDQPLPVIKYMKLFDETRDGDQGKFAETLRDQHLYDSVACYPAIENAIREEVMKNDARASAEGACVTTLKIVMTGIHKYDPGLATAGSTLSPPQAPEAVLQRLVACGLGEPVEKWPFSDFRKVDVEEFCQRLRALVIKRYSIPPEEDDEQKAAKALRSMLPEERKLLEEVFAQMDADYSGYLSRNEIGDLLEEVYGEIVDDRDKPGEYIGGSFTPHDFSGAPEELVVLLDQNAPSIAGHGGAKELVVKLDQNIPDIKAAVEVLQPQLNGVWVQPPVRTTCTAKRLDTAEDRTGPASRGTNQLSLDTVQHIRPGDSISGSGICAGTTVVAVDEKKNVVTLSSETGAFDWRGEPKDTVQGVMNGGAVNIDHVNNHLVGDTSGVITLTSCTADEYSSVSLALDSCGPHALALLEDPDGAPGQVVAAKQSQLKQMVHKFDLNNDDCVTLDEFLRAVVTVPELKIVGDVFKWKNVFDTYDADNSGEVDRDELELMVQDIVGTKEPENETAEEKAARKKSEKKEFDKIMKLVQSFDTADDEDEPDGLVSWKEFLSAMKQLNNSDGLGEDA